MDRLPVKLIHYRPAFSGHVQPKPRNLGGFLIGAGTVFFFGFAVFALRARIQIVLFVVKPPPSRLSLARRMSHVARRRRMRTGEGSCGGRGGWRVNFRFIIACVERSDRSIRSTNPFEPLKRLEREFFGRFHKSYTNVGAISCARRPNATGHCIIVRRQTARHAIACDRSRDPVCRHEVHAPQIDSARTCSIQLSIYPAQRERAHTHTHTRRSRTGCVTDS